MQHNRAVWHPDDLRSRQQAAAERCDPYDDCWSDDQYIYQSFMEFNGSIKRTADELGITTIEVVEAINRVA